MDIVDTDEVTEEMDVPLQHYHLRLHYRQHRLQHHCLRLLHHLHQTQHQVHECSPQPNWSLRESLHLRQREKKARSNPKTELKAKCLKGSSELRRTEGDEVAAFAIGFLGVTVGTDRATIA